MTHIGQIVFWDGKLTGHELGRERIGTWKITEDERCLTYKAKHVTTDCYEIWVKDDRVEYRRDGATIAEALIQPLP